MISLMNRFSLMQWKPHRIILSTNLSGRLSWISFTQCVKHHEELSLLKLVVLLLPFIPVSHCSTMFLLSLLESPHYSKVCIRSVFKVYEWNFLFNLDPLCFHSFFYDETITALVETVTNYCSNMDIVLRALKILVLLSQKRRTMIHCSF